MAEKKEKGDEGESKKSKHPSGEELITEFIAVAILLLLLVRVFSLAGGSEQVGGTDGGGIGNAFRNTFGGLWSQLVTVWQTIVSVFIVMSNVLSAFFIIALVYASIKLNKIDIEWRKQLYPVPKPEDEIRIEVTRWDQVISHIQSDNPSDWRLAILEADIVLDELLDRLGYAGDTIADKLKAADNLRMKTLDSAWEAHKIRNAIAHEGQDFILTQREARRIVGLYESVFREFDYI